jgi:integrase
VTAIGKLGAWLKKLEAADPTAVDLTLEVLLENFLAARAGKSLKTQANEKWFAKILRKTFLPGTGVAVRKIKTSDLLKWLNHEAAAGNWGPRTFNRARLFLRQLFDLAVADEAITDSTSPFRAKQIRPKKPEKVRRNIPTDEQFEAIIANVRAQRDNPDHEESANFLEFLGRAGVGQAEAASVKWRDINGEKITFVRRKTQREFQIPIYPWLKPLMARLHAARTSDDGEQNIFKIKDAGHALDNACERLSLPRFTQRNLRAMCIKRLYDARVPVKRIALWQGHSDGGQLIQQVYSEVFSDGDAAAEAADLALVTAATSNGEIIQFGA